MTGRLDQLCFLPPRVGTPWTGQSCDSTAQQITRHDGILVEIKLPLFWYDPPWHHLDAEIADVVATVVAESGVIVSAMRSDLSGPNREPILHSYHRSSDEAASDQLDGHEGLSDDDTSPLPRMVPYRHERYGLSDLDFDDAKVIDLRLSASRDESGRFCYSPERIQRWEATPSSQPVAGGGWVAAATFLPDVESIDTLSAKIDQLRALSPEAAVLVSIDAHLLEMELDVIAASDLDGLIVRMDEMNLSGKQLALLTQQARKLADEVEIDLPLWVVPGEITAEDAAKLIALGASAVAIDSWGREIIDQIMIESESSSSGYATSSRASQQRVNDLVDEQFLPKVERASGFIQAMRCVAPDQPLGCLSRSWAKALGIPALTVARLSKLPE